MFNNSSSEKEKIKTGKSIQETIFSLFIYSFVMVVFIYVATKATLKAQYDAYYDSYMKANIKQQDMDIRKYAERTGITIKESARIYYEQAKILQQLAVLKGRKALNNLKTVKIINKDVVKNEKLIYSMDDDKDSYIDYNNVKND